MLPSICEQTALPTRQALSQQKCCTDMKKTKAQAKISKVMKEFGAGKLTSNKKVVKDPKQAMAIALSQAGKAKKK